MSPKERSHIDNAIWLCANHAALIDRDSTIYTIECLREMKRNHEAACAENVRRASRESALSDDLVAIGPDIVCTGELRGVDASGWTLHLKHFVIGDFNSLVSYIARFPNSLRDERYVLVNALGDGRVLTEAPSLTQADPGYLVRCQVARSFPRIEAQQLGLTDPERGRFARGVAALPLVVHQCLSIQRGKLLFRRDYGARLAEYFEAFHNSPWLGHLLKLEAIRLSAIPYHDPIMNKQNTPLRCVERVHRIEVLAESPGNQRLPICVDFDVCGVGRWQHELSILLPSSTIEKYTSSTSPNSAR